MFSRSCLLLLALLIHKTSNNEVMTRFCLSTDTHACAEKSPNPEGCCVDFFELSSNKPSTSHTETRVDCRERVVMVKTISSLCEDVNMEWVQNSLKAYDWCLRKGYASKQDNSKMCSLSFKQFVDAETTENCCFLFSQTPADVSAPRAGNSSDVCEQISFNVTLQTDASDCTRRPTGLHRAFIRRTYNCLRWAF